MKIGDISKSNISHIDAWREVSQVELNPLALTLDAMSSQMIELAQQKQDGMVSAHLFAIACNITALANHLKVSPQSEIKPNDLLAPACSAKTKPNALVCDFRVQVGVNGGLGGIDRCDQ